MATPYLDLAGFKDLSVAPASRIDEIETQEPGWVLAQLTHYSGWLDARLRKRYAAPFAAPYPETIKGWLARLVTPPCYLKGGVNALDAQFDLVRQDAEDARTEIKEAADSKEGLFDLPLRSDTTETGISKGAPLGYSEASPYTWSAQQRAAAESDPT